MSFSFLPPPSAGSSSSSSSASSTLTFKGMTFLESVNPNAFTSDRRDILLYEHDVPVSGTLTLGGVLMARQRLSTNAVGGRVECVFSRDGTGNVVNLTGVSGTQVLTNSFPPPANSRPGMNFRVSGSKALVVGFGKVATEIEWWFYTQAFTALKGD